MKAVRYHEFGSPEKVLTLEDLPEPVPGPGEAVVRVGVAGINFGDTFQIRGNYPGAVIPGTPGAEAVGVVSSIGEGVSVVAVGDQVAVGGNPGTCAEKVVVPADRLIPLPDGVEPKQACAVLMQGRTAHYLTQDAYPIREGDRVLIHSGAGGVGSILSQLAKRAGAYVFATVSSDAKAAFASEMGADEVINYSRQDFAQEVLAATGGEGVHAVYDAIGRTTLEGNLRCTARRGHLVMYGEASGPPPPVDFGQMAMRSRGSIYVSTHFGADYRQTREEQIGRAHDLFRWLRESAIQAHVHKEYPLEQTAEAYRDIESRHTTGKLLLVL